MNYLLDTHTIIWSLVSPSKLSLKIRTIIESKENTCWVSAVTFWEISLKYAIGKLHLKGMRPDELHEYSKNAGFAILDLHSETAASFYKLIKFRSKQSFSKNKDPFDLMLAWQAISKDCHLLTQDQDFADYKDQGLKIVW